MFLQWWSASRERCAQPGNLHPGLAAVGIPGRAVERLVRPGRIAEIVEIGLPRPRSVETRATAEFGRHSLEIYDILTGRMAGETPQRPLQVMP